MIPFLSSGPFIEWVTTLYGAGDKEKQKNQQRYQNLIQNFQERFSLVPEGLFSSPGRTEIGGNHTDHNHGRVLAAAVNLDSIAVAAKITEDQITLHSEGYDEAFSINLHDLDHKNDEEGTTSALIRGIASRLKQSGYRIGGFKAFISSEVLPGSGLSSSASIEILITSIFNVFFNGGNIPPREMALISQYAENVFFNKPCGLMDQLACAIGGFVTIDFANPGKPVVKQVKFDFEQQEYSLVVVNTGGSHADLTDDYAAVPAEMKHVARSLGKEVCRELSSEVILSNINKIRRSVGDRGLLRSLHFLQEDQRVVKQVQALEKSDFSGFLRLINASGKSSCCWLQNCYSPVNVKEQGIMLALCLTEQVINDLGEGACRVHGGGFAGTIQVFLPRRHVSEYIRQIESVFGQDSAVILNIRSQGSQYLAVTI